MKTLTQRMIERVEWLASEYNRIIQSNTGDPADTEPEFGQLRRINEMLSYLEDRIAR